MQDHQESVFSNLNLVANIANFLERLTLSNLKLASKRFSTFITTIETTNFKNALKFFINAECVKSPNGADFFIFSDIQKYSRELLQKIQANQALTLTEKKQIKHILNYLLYNAVVFDYSAMLPDLAQLRADIRGSINNFGKKSVHLATQNWYTFDIISNESLKKLIQHGASIDDIDYAGNTALHEFVVQTQTEICSGQDVSSETINITLNHLLSLNANPNTQNNNGETPIHIACSSLFYTGKCQSQPIYSFINSSKAINWNIQNLQGETALFIFIKKLSENLKYADRFPDLIALSVQESFQLFKDLVGQGAQTAIKDKAGNSVDSIVEDFPDEIKTLFLNGKAPTLEV